MNILLKLYVTYLQRMMGGNVAKEKVESIAIRTMREADCDADGSITFQEFCRVRK
jgi:Ca2+-binding EF-hand superfamily protein